MTHIELEKINNFTNFLEEEGKSKSTIINYKSDIKKVLGIMYKQKFDTKKAINKILSLNYSVNTLKRIKCSFNIFCDFIKKPEWKIKLKINHFITFRMNIIENIHIKSILDKIDDEISSEDDQTKKSKLYIEKISILLGSSLGLRVSEYKNLSFSGVFKNNVIEIKKGKHESYRSLPIPETLQKSIKELHKILKKMNISYSDNIFEKSNGKMITTRTFSRWLKKWALLSKVPGDIAKTHSLRHRFAHNYLESNTDDLISLKNILGHNSIDTTSLYLVPSQKKLQKNINKACFFCN